VKRIPILVLVSILWTAFPWNGGPALAAEVRDATITAYFSPNGGCTEAVVEALRQAKQTVLVQAYSFTSASIAKALVDAHKRGVRVEVILDKSQRKEKYSSADFLANSGIPTRIDAQHAHCPQ
jgi:phosphatidylserine/phosphatidylglycerophosphate/cardiolipin synthase-like enzyme